MKLATAKLPTLVASFSGGSFSATVRTTLSGDDLYINATSPLAGASLNVTGASATFNKAKKTVTLTLPAASGSTMVQMTTFTGSTFSPTSGVVALEPYVSGRTLFSIAFSFKATAALAAATPYAA